MSDGSFIKAVAPALLEYLSSLEDREKKTVELANPDEVRRAFSSQGVSLDLGEPQTQETLLKAVELVLEYSVRTGHPHFLNQLYARADEVAIAGEWVLGATNTNSHTFECAPVYSVIELTVVAKVASVLGPGWAGCDGLSVPGGSISNLYAMHAARCEKQPDMLQTGMSQGPRMVAFTSDQAHYSYLKTARLLGIGSDNLIVVPTTDDGRLRGDALREAVKKARADGGVPFFVGATAGTTVLGAFDAFGELAEVCKEEGLWLHVDGCWGGSLIVSQKHRARVLGGVELADSFAWNPHKMLGATLQTSLFLCRRQGFLKKINASNAAYLFQPDKENKEFDLGDLTIQCGRKPDCLKLWLLWQKLGDAGLAARADKCVEYCELLESKLRAHDHFQIAYPSACSNVGFWWVPPALRSTDLSLGHHASLSQDHRALLHAQAPRIKAQMQKNGEALIGFQSVNDRPNFFRCVFANVDCLTPADLDKILGDIDRIGESAFTVSPL